MGHMKRVEQMLRDGSFDKKFMPAYNKAIKNDDVSFLFSGVEVSTEYADAVVSFVDDLRKCDEFKQ